MMSPNQIHRTASALIERMGEVAVAAAILNAQGAHAERRYKASADWYHVAEAALSRIPADIVD